MTKRTSKQDNLSFLKNRGFEIIETPTGFKFLIQPRGTGANNIPDLYIGKDECHVIQQIGVLLEIRSDVYRNGRPPTLHTIVQTHASLEEEHRTIS
jgi:hypothetical protein